MIEKTCGQGLSMLFDAAGVAVFVAATEGIEFASAYIGISSPPALDQIVSELDTAFDWMEYHMIEPNTHPCYEHVLSVEYAFDQDFTGYATVTFWSSMGQTCDHYTGANINVQLNRGWLPFAQSSYLYDGR